MSDDYDLESFVAEGVRRAQERGYHPIGLLQMRERHGTAEAIRRLVRSGDIQSGFKRLAELELSEWSVEAAVLRFPEEFSRQDQQAAEWRLIQARKTDTQTS